MAAGAGHHLEQLISLTAVYFQCFSPSLSEQNMLLGIAKRGVPENLCPVSSSLRIHCRIHAFLRLSKDHLRLCQEDHEAEEEGYQQVGCLLWKAKGSISHCFIQNHSIPDW